MNSSQGIDLIKFEAVLKNIPCLVQITNLAVMNRYIDFAKFMVYFVIKVEELKPVEYVSNNKVNIVLTFFKRAHEKHFAYFFYVV